MARIIYTAVRNYSLAYAESGNLPQDLPNFRHLRSSLSLEAGRTTLQVIKNQESLLGEDPSGQDAPHDL